jgi:hypothetical protein
VTACVLTGIEWWTNTLVIAAFTLAGRWICVGVWRECERERQREQRRQWLQQRHDRNRRP